MNITSYLSIRMEPSAGCRPYQESASSFFYERLVAELSSLLIIIKSATAA